MSGGPTFSEEIVGDHPPCFGLEIGADFHPYCASECPTLGLFSRLAHRLPRLGTKTAVFGHYFAIFGGEKRAGISGEIFRNLGFSKISGGPAFSEKIAGDHPPCFGLEIGADFRPDCASACPIWGPFSPRRAAQRRRCEIRIPGIKAYAAWRRWWRFPRARFFRNGRIVNLPGWRWARIMQLVLVGSSSSLHSEACNALGGSDGVAHSKISLNGVTRPRGFQQASRSDGPAFGPPVVLAFGRMLLGVALFAQSVLAFVAFMNSTMCCASQFRISGGP